MKLRNVLLLAMVALPGPVLLSGCASPPPVTTSVSDDAAVTITAVVESVDMARRAVLLSGPRGGLQTIFVSDEVRNLAQVKAGDRVNITYREAWAAEIVAPGTPGGGTTAVLGAARSPAGTRPAGAVGGELQTRVRVQSIDLASNTVTFTRPDGLVRSVSVRRPLGQQFIRGLKPGDEVEVTYTEALALSVTPAN